VQVVQVVQVVEPDEALLSDADFSIEQPHTGETQ
jgi:hypothetical protein